MFDDQETHYPVPGETPWERLRYGVIHVFVM